MLLPWERFEALAEDDYDISSSFLLVANGGFSGLAALLSLPSTQAAHQAAWALAQLAASEKHIDEIVASGFFSPLVLLLEHACDAVASQAAAALCQLATGRPAVSGRITAVGGLQKLLVACTRPCADLAVQALAAVGAIAACNWAVATRALARADARKALVAALISALGHEFSENAAQAASALARLALGSRDASSAMAELEARAAAGRRPDASGPEFDAPAAIPALVALLGHSRAEVAAAGANALRALCIASQANADALVASKCGCLKTLQQLLTARGSSLSAVQSAADTLACISLRGHAAAVAAAGGIAAAAALLDAPAEDGKLVCGFTPQHAACSLLASIATCGDTLRRAIAATGCIPRLAASLAVEGMYHAAAAVLANLAQSDVGVRGAIVSVALPALVQLLQDPSQQTAGVAAQTLANIVLSNDDASAEQTAAARRALAEVIAAAGALPCLVALLRGPAPLLAQRTVSAVYGICACGEALCRKAVAAGAVPCLLALANSPDEALRALSACTLELLLASARSHEMGVETANIAPLTMATSGSHLHQAASLKRIASAKGVQHGSASLAKADSAGQPTVMASRHSLVASKGHWCTVCGRQQGQPGVTRLLACSVCRSALYCSAECREADWPAHEAICGTMAAVKGRRFSFFLSCLR